MGRIFEDQNITPDKKVLPHDKFKLFYGYEYKDLVPEKMKVIIEKAEAAIQEDIPLLPLSLYRDFWKTGNRENYERVYFKRRTNLFTMILAEAYEKKGRFTEKIVDYIWVILEETAWLIPAHAKHTPSNDDSSVPTVYRDSDIHGVDLFSAETAAVLTAALLFLSKEISDISPIIVERLEYSIIERVIKPFLNVTFIWTGELTKRPNNWCPWIVANVLFSASVIIKDLDMRCAIVKRAMRYLDNYIEGQPEDGGCDEGPGYWNAAGGALFDGLELIYDMTGGAIDVFDYPKLQKIGEYVSFANIHDKRYVNFGDSYAKMYPNGYLLMRFGERTGSKALYAFGKSVAPNYKNYASRSLVYRAIKDLFMPIPTESTPTKSPTKGYLPDLKLMIARESEDTGKGLYVACKGGHNQESHNHNDVGSFIVYYDGEPVIIDPGKCEYTRDTFGPKRYTIWAMQSHYHNLPAFGGIGQKPGKEYASTREVYDEITGKISYGLEGAYPKEANLLEYTRSAELTNGTVIITEDIHQACEQEIDFRIMLHREPTVIEEGKIELTEGRVLEYDTGLGVEIEVFDPVGMNCVSSWDSEVLYRLHFRTTAKDFACKFIVL